MEIQYQLMHNKFGELNIIHMSLQIAYSYESREAVFSMESAILDVMLSLVVTILEGFRK